jgi:mono/diheme cytochrome c family protein
LVVKFMRSKFSFSLQMFAQMFLQTIVVALAVISLGTACSAAQNKSAHVKPEAAKAQTASAGGSDVARGKYIVEGVALCGQCHTPVDSEGNPDRRRWLQGGSVPWQSSRPNTDWPQMVPRIGGIPPAPDEDMVKLLTTGIWTTGARLRAPMPQFRMNVSDAQAVVAYLKSLTPGQ